MGKHTPLTEKSRRKTQKKQITFYALRTKGSWMKPKQTFAYIQDFFNRGCSKATRGLTSFCFICTMRRTFGSPHGIDSPRILYKVSYRNPYMIGILRFVSIYLDLQGHQN